MRWKITWNEWMRIYEYDPESKECLRIRSAHLFSCSRSLVFGVQCDVEKLPHAVVRRTLLRGKCRDPCADWESRRRLWSARCYSFSAGRWDLRLSCRRGKLSRGIVLLYDNTSAYCPADTRIAALAIPLGHFRTSSVLSGHATVGLYRFANDEDLEDASWITRRPHSMKRVFHKLVPM